MNYSDDIEIEVGCGFVRSTYDDENEIIELTIDDGSDYLTIRLSKDNASKLACALQEQSEI